jgi:hypothetical protein
MASVDELIRATFDFDLEDQPDEISDYKDIVNTMWLESSIQNTDNMVYKRIKEIIDSNLDPEDVINFYFMSNKHDKRDLLLYAKEYYENEFLSQKDLILDQRKAKLKEINANR